MIPRFSGGYAFGCGHCGGESDSCFALLDEFLLCLQKRKASIPSTSTPRGTPIPAPRAVARLLLLLDDGEGGDVAEGEEAPVCAAATGSKADPELVIVDV